MIINIRQVQHRFIEGMQSYAVDVNDCKMRATLSAMSALTNWTNQITTAKAARIVSDTIKITLKVVIPKQLIFNYIAKVKCIQRKWKRLLKLNNFRKELLRNKWKSVVNKLIRENLNKGGKNSLLAKLQGISMKSCNRILDRYFNIRKDDHQRNLRKFHVIFI